MTAEQLNVAHGQVRCGYCQTVFDALGSLEDDWKDKLPGYRQGSTDTDHDNKEPGDQQDTATDNETGSQEQPGQHPDEEQLLSELLSEKDDKLPRPPAPVTTEDEPSALAELHTGGSDSTPDSVNIRQQAETLFGELQHRIDAKNPSQDTTEQQAGQENLPQAALDSDNGDTAPADSELSSGTQEHEAPPGDSNDGPSTDIPGILREELAAINGKQENRHTAAWFSGIVLAIILLLAQGLYYFRNQLAMHENYRGLVVAMCNVMDCEVPLRNDARNGIKTMVMRSHAIQALPGHDDRLQISAIFSNTANYRQAYPQLSVKMTDESGRVTAMRRFLPQEYLAEHIDHGQGLPAHTSVEIILDIIKPQQPVISYHFDFL